MFASGSAGLVLYLALWAGRFTWFEDLLVVISIALAVPCAVILLWVSWASRLRRRAGQWFEEPFETSTPRPAGDR